MGAGSGRAQTAFGPAREVRNASQRIHLIALFIHFQGPLKQGAFFVVFVP